MVDTVTKTTRLLQTAGVALMSMAVVVAAMPACLSAESKPDQNPAKSEHKLEISSPAFQHGQPVPKEHTGDGSDRSPPLTWAGVPEKTHSFALICDDPDAPAGTWVHWVIYDIPAATRALKEGVPRDKELADGAKQGKNSSGKIGYNGPAPPAGKAHRYFFKLYALDQAAGLKPGATKQEVLKAVQGHTLAEAETMGTYKR